MSESSLEDYAFFENEPAPEPVVKREWQPLWKSSSEKVKPEPKAFIVSGAPAPAGSCEFVGDLLYVGSSGRHCTLGGSCFLFLKASDYVNCPSRAEKLKDKKEQL